MDYVERLKPFAATLTQAVDIYIHHRQPAPKKGFAPVAFRWRIERTFAWFGQCRLLSKEYEKTVASAEAWLWCAMMRLLVRRLSC